MVWKRTILPVLFLAALFSAGCSPEMTGDLGRDQMFIPAFNTARGRLILDLTQAGAEGGLKFFFLDFAGQKISSRIMKFPNAKKSWSWDIGRGAMVKGKRFYALRIVRLGPARPRIGFAFLPLGAPEKVRRGGSLSKIKD